MDCDAVEFVLCTLGTTNIKPEQNVAGTNRQYILTQEEYNDLYGDVIVSHQIEEKDAHKIEENNAHKIKKKDAHKIEENNAHKIKKKRCSQN